MFYLGFVKNTLKDVVIFRAMKKPTRGSYPFFLSVLGPYNSESAARLALKRLKGEGYRENPACCKKCRRTKNIMSAEKALRLTKKVYGYAKDVYQDYKSNPGSEFHSAKFTQYMEELKNYEPGSVLHISLLARAYEHLESARESDRRGIK